MPALNTVAAAKKPTAKKSRSAVDQSAQKPAKKNHKYRLMFHLEALEEWRSLDNAVRQPLKKLLEKRLNSPRVPGGELHPPLSGCYKIKMKKAGVRLVYEVDDVKLIVTVLAVDKRENEAVYNSATKRVKALAANILAAAKKVK